MTEATSDLFVKLIAKIIETDCDGVYPADEVQFIRDCMDTYGPRALATLRDGIVSGLETWKSAQGKVH